MKKRALSLAVVMTLVLTLVVGQLMASAAAGTDVSTNFDGNTYDSAAWVINSKAEANTDDTSLAIAGDKLVYTGGSNNTWFGPKEKYGDFTISFDISSVGSATPFISLMYGLDVQEGMFWTAGVNTIFLNPISTRAMNAPNYLAAVNAGTDYNSTDVTASLTRPTYGLVTSTEVLNYKIIVKAGSAYVYYKKASDPAAELTTLRTKFDGLLVKDGYLKLGTSTAGAFSLDNISIKTDTTLPTPPAKPGSDMNVKFDANTFDNTLWKLNPLAEDNTTVNSSVAVVNNKLVYTACSNNSWFGPKDLYQDFTVSFNVESVMEGTPYVILVYGLDAQDNMFWNQGINTIFLNSNSTRAMSNATWLKAKDTTGTDYSESGDGETRPGYELWSDSGTPQEVLNYKIIVKAGSAYVYYKKASDPASTLDILRIKFDGLNDKQGFWRLASTTGGTFTLDDIAISLDTTIPTAPVVSSSSTPSSSAPSSSTPDASTPESSTVSAPTSSSSTDSGNPNTADTMFFPVLIVMGLIAGTGIVLFRKKIFIKQ